MMTSPNASDSGALDKARPMSALGRGVLVNLIGFGIFMLCQFVALSLVARLAGPEGAGLYGLALGIVVPVYLFTNMSLRPAFATDLGGQWSFFTYQRLRIVSAVLGIGLSVLVGALIRPELGFVVLVAIMAVAKVGEALSDLGYGVYQAVERVGLTGKSLTLRGLFGIALFAVGAWGALTLAPGAPMAILIAACIGLCLGWWGVWLLVDRRSTLQAIKTHLMTQRPDILEPSRNAWSLIWTVAPLGAAVFAGTLQNMGPRFVVEDVFSLAAVGLFAAITSLTSLGVQAVNMIGQVLAPRMAHAIRTAHLGRYVLYLAGLIAFAALGGAVYIALGQIWGAPVLTLLFGEAFAQGADLFAVLALAGAVRFVAEAMRVAMVAARGFRLRLVFELVALGILIVAVVKIVAGGDVIEMAYAILAAEIASSVLLIGFIGTVLVLNRRPSHRSGAIGD